MKLTKYITTACIAALFTGCDYLDFDETTGMTKEEMYSYFGIPKRISYCTEVLW